MLTEEEKDLVVAVITMYSHQLLAQRCQSTHGDTIKDLQEDYETCVSILDKMNDNTWS